MSQPSLADNVIITLAQVRAIGEQLDTDHPMRHIVRRMKMFSEQIISDALRQASNLAYEADQVINDYDKANKGEKP